MIVSLGFVAIYVLVIGVASFMEEPAGRGFGAFQLNSLIRFGSLAAALAAFFAVDRAALPATPWLLAGLGVGLVTGLGSICYCLSLDCLPVSLVVTLANLYLVVTVVLGMVVLHDPVTVLTLAGLVCTLAGMLILVHPPARSTVRSGASITKGPSVRAFAVMGAYILLIGAGAFLEKPVLEGMDATQLNALQAVGMAAVAAVALAVKGPPLPRTNRSLAGFGLGAMMGLASVFYFLGLRGLPVSVAAAFSNASMVVTVLLSAIVLRQRLTPMRGGAMALMLLGVTLLAFAS